MCFNPITIKVDNYQGVRYIQVPCGKCLDCKRQYQNDWMVRLVEESRNYSRLCFVTLTYNNNNVPMFVDESTGERHLSVYKKHVQDWLKRFRQYNVRNRISRPFKYFITSEYGPRTLRPHYHCLFFGLSTDDLYSALNDWRKNFGFVSAKDLPFTSSDKLKVSRYVSKYCSKGVFECPKVGLGLVYPTFHLISKGLGVTYVFRMKDFHTGKTSYPGKLHIDGKYSPSYLEFITTNRNVYLDGFYYHMPRYYSSKIYGTKNTLSLQVADFLFEKRCKLFDEKLAQLQAQHPDWSASYASYQVALSDFDETQRRQKDLQTTLGRFYDKSRI